MSRIVKIVDDNQNIHDLGNPLPTTFSGYTIAVEYSGNNAIYIGEAEPGTSQSSTGWRIKKITYDGSDNPTDVKWADGVNMFTKVWDDRASYTYS